MQNYDLELTCQPSTGFRCIKAANSLDIDINKKLNHKFHVEADLETEYNIGLIVGASGSGKTTLAKHIWGEDCVKEILDKEKPVIEQLPEHYEYKDCVVALNGSGLTSVPCWIRPSKTLSNGQQSRAELALQLASDKKIIVIDEFTSVVDRTIAKAMAMTVQKAARKLKKKVVLLSCHYDIIEWLNPEWIIDCNKQKYIDRRSFFLTINEKRNLNLKSPSAKNPAGNILANIII